ncbi:MAG: HNH endonuclease [Lachnospiraceae bacterium]|nr:HNH endonuclease [Lachnospiraceae bacterium]
MKSRYSFKDYDNKAFYNSAAWQRVSSAYMNSRSYICERCGKPAVICHHKKWLNGENVKDPYVALSFENLEALCLECHNIEHGLNHSVAIFDEDGDISRVRESQEAKEFKKNQEQIENLLRGIESRKE